jgi:hypothetical protein
VSQPRIDATNPHCRRISLEYQIENDDWVDRALIWRYGARASLEYEVWGGLILLACTRIGKMVHRMFILLEPLTESRSMARIFAVGSGPRPLLELRATLSKRFFKLEADSCRGMRVNTERLGPNDRILGEYVRWAQGLVGAGGAGL